MHDRKLERLIYRYRMLGFDRPVFETNTHFNCRTINVVDPCGQWKLIKGTSDYSFMIGALKWVNANFRYINKEREIFIRKYLKNLNYNVKKILLISHGN